jgi:membrane protein
MRRSPQQFWNTQQAIWQTRQARLQSHAQTWWNGQHPASQSLLLHLRAAVEHFVRDGSTQAASLAYYAIFSVFPLTPLAAVVLSALLGPVVAAQQIQFILEPFLPPASAQSFDLIRENIAQALEQSTSFGVIALISLAWSGLGLFSAITTALDTIFAAPGARSLWRQRATALLMAFMLLLLILMSFLTSAVLRVIAAALLERPSLWVNAGTVFLPLGLNMVIFALLFRYIPARRVYWDAVWPAAIVGAVGWELAKSAFGWYLTNVANYQFVYGSIATVIVLLFWAYVIALIFMFSAQLCAQLNLWVIATRWTEREAAAFENRALAIIFPADETERDLLDDGDADAPLSRR